MEKFNFQSLVKEKNGPVVDASSFKSGFEKVFAPYKQSEPDQIVDLPSAHIESPPPQPAPPVVQNSYNEKDLTDSKTKGFEEGYAKGYKDAKSASDELNAKINESLNVVVGKLGEVLQAKKFEDEQNNADVAQMVIRVAKKVSDAAFVNNSAEAIEKVVSKSFEMLFSEPKIIISVNSAVADGISERIAALAKDSGFKGEFEIKPTNNIGAGGCEIEWQGGGLKCDKDSAWQEIDKIAGGLFGENSKVISE